MISFDPSEALVLLLAGAVIGALLVVLPPWRALLRSAPRLPIHRHLPDAPFDAQVRCALCAGRAECQRRGAPLADCPNLELLAKVKAL